MSLVEKKWDGYLQSSYVAGFFMTRPDLVCTGLSFGCWSTASISFSQLISWSGVRLSASGWP